MLTRIVFQQNSPPLFLSRRYYLNWCKRIHHVVDAFFTAEDEILSIKKKYKDEQESLLVQMVGKKI